MAALPQLRAPAQPLSGCSGVLLSSFPPEGTTQNLNMADLSQKHILMEYQREAVAPKGVVGKDAVGMMAEPGGGGFLSPRLWTIGSHCSSYPWSYHDEKMEL